MPSDASFQIALSLRASQVMHNWSASGWGSGYLSMLQGTRTLSANQPVGAMGTASVEALGVLLHSERAVWIPVDHVGPWSRPTAAGKK